MSRRRNNSGIDWNLTRTVAAIRMGMPGAFPGMPVYDNNEEDEAGDDNEDNDTEENDEDSNTDDW